MRQITFLTLDNQVYVSATPRAPQDVAVPDRPSPKHHFNRDAWEWALPEPSLETARLAKLDEIEAAYNTVMDYIQAGYPLKEVLTWERQSAQARELIENPEAGALFVRTLAAVKQIPVEEMCRRILDNAEDWEPVAAMLTGQRQIMEERAFKAQTLEDLQAIRVGYSV